MNDATRIVNNMRNHPGDWFTEGVAFEHRPSGLRFIGCESLLGFCMSPSTTITPNLGLFGGVRVVRAYHRWVSNRLVKALDAPEAKG